MAPEAFFLTTPAGQRFCLHHPPERAAANGQSLVFIHPFAEEMNKSRRMATLQSRALAAAGHRVLQVDLQGCGDSSGEFSEATWTGWVDDVRRALFWLRERSPAPLWLWGLRAGCLVAAAAARGLPWPVNFLFWQPASSGRLHLQQFLRLAAAGVLAEGDSRGVGRQLRDRLAAGETVEVAGYELPAALAAGLEGAELAPVVLPGRLEWLEVAAGNDVGLAPASLKCLAAWREAGHRTQGRAIPGRPFWQTVDTTECRALVDATLAALAEEPCP